MNTKYYSIFLFLCISTLACAQTGTISGTIHTVDGRPAESVNITIKGTNRGATADGRGNYQINNVREGTQVVVASFIGLVTQEQTVTVRAGETAVVNFVLAENEAQLREVIVSAQRSPNRNTQVAKIPLKNLENPQVYNSVSAEVMKQQVVTTYDDAFRNIPGITRTWEATGRAGDGAAYFALRGFDAQPALTNGLPGLASGNLDPANVEEIQVIKGPSGTLFGGSFYSYGGLINTVTKQPYDGFGGEVTYNFGSYGLNRITADINTPLSKTEKITARVNAAYHSEGSFQDAGFKKSFFIAPTLAYHVNDRLSFNVMAEILEEERSVAPVFFHSDRLSPLDFRTIEELNLNPKLSFTSNDITIKNPKYNLQAQMVYKLSEQWTSQTVVSRGTVKSDGYYTYIWDDVAGDNSFSQYFHKEQFTLHTTTIQQNFNGDFRIGNLRNRLLVGLDYYSRNAIDNGSGWGWARNVTPQGDVDYIDPFSGEELPPVYLTQASVENLLGGLEGTSSNIVNSSYGAYFSNVLNVTPGLTAMVSLRADYFDSKGEKSMTDDDYDQFALSPKLGLVYQPLRDKLSLFVNYMNAFINVDPQSVYDTDGNFLEVKSFKPEQANQWEYGVKANLFGDKLFGTVSVYDIKVSDRVYPDPANPNNSVQGGKVGSKGFEIDLNAHPARGLSLLAGYSYNETKVITGNGDDFYSEPGRSPGGQGPQHLANLWANYRFPEGKLKNYGVGLGGNYAGRYKVIDNSATGVFYLPAYTLVNASLFYNGDRVRITANLNNLTNEQYYTGYWSVNPQKRRNFAASIAYKF
ncbi:TonB-dependent receptor [Parapedobacter defluvii]|uniref:TonB-dependent receptor n=1 Tax=Parapedobacter defluvii TaxID=2045106 RepID=A0ABQ1L036_9SPHI|nr:TonB-dependent receptor [Parapedobacter defluvii]GGC14134.1 TonB-dependent receptor [Parapedobacter defluvii]